MYGMVKKYTTLVYQSLVNDQGGFMSTGKWNKVLSCQLPKTQRLEILVDISSNLSNVTRKYAQI